MPKRQQNKAIEWPDCVPRPKDFYTKVASRLTPPTTRQAVWRVDHGLMKSPRIQKAINLARAAIIREYRKRLAA